MSAKILIQIRLPGTGNATHIMPARVPAFHALTGPLAPLPAVFVFIPSFFSLSWCRVRRVGEDSNPNSLVRHGQRYKYYAGKGAGVPCSYWTAGNLPAVFVFIPSFFSCPGVVFAVSAKIPIQIPLPDTGNATHIMPARVPAFHENNQ